MNKILRNFFVAAMAIMSVSAMAQTTVTFDAATDKGTKTASDPGEDQITKDGVTIAVSNGAMNLTDEYRCYKGQTFTVTSTVGNITKVELSCKAEGAAKYGPGCFTDATAGAYTFEGKVGTWTGDAATFTMTASTNQVRINTVVVTLADGGGSQSQDIAVGIVRPTFTASDGTVTYDTWNYIETVDKFNKSADGLTVKFFQTPEIEATFVKDETQEGGYEVKNVCHQGVKNIPCDYVWKLNCAEYDGSLKRHKNETLGSEKWAFGFDLTVAEGKSFTVNAIDFDLLVEQNPIYRIRIMKGDTEVYNSTWITKTGGYNNEQWGAGSYCRITKEDVSFLYEKKDAEGNAINYQAIQFYPGFEEGVGTMTPLGALTLEAGTYRVIAEVDFAKDSSKALSFDNFTLEGTVGDGGSTPAEEGQKWDFTKWSDATVAALKADAAASKTEGWSDVEKKADAEAGADPTEVAKDNCFWFAGTANADGTLSANGVVIEELKGLKFGNADYNAARSLAIAVNYQTIDTSKDFGPYQGASYLWLGGKGKLCFTIPNVAAGSTITIEAESHKISDPRGIQLKQGETQIGDDFKPTTFTSNSWTIENAGDVDVWNTNGCHIYTITVKGGATGISTVKAQKVQDNAIYNLAGQKVGKDYKGIVIMNGKKVVLK